MEANIEDFLLSKDLCEEDCTIVIKLFQLIFVWINLMMIILSIINLYSMLNNW
uniref:Proteasome subunit beta n=1 Tax=Parascaris univalens TaxID=6257 RepID=A0A915BSN6_PARUN